MKKEENFSKCLFDIVLHLIIIQAIFLGIKQITFHFIAEELFSRSMVTMVSMTIGIIFLWVYSKWRSSEFSVLPVKFGKVYIVATIFSMLFFVVTLFLIREFSLQNMLMILYGGIVASVDRGQHGQEHPDCAPAALLSLRVRPVRVGRVPCRDAIWAFLTL